LEVHDAASSPLTRLPPYAKAVPVLLIVARVVKLIVTHNLLVALPLGHTLILVLVGIKIIHLILVIGIPSRQGVVGDILKSFHGRLASATDVFNDRGLDFVQIVVRVGVFHVGRPNIKLIIGRKVLWLVSIDCGNGSTRV
jgi:hypothetical protein